MILENAIADLAAGNGPFAGAYKDAIRTVRPADLARLDEAKRIIDAIAYAPLRQTMESALAGQIRMLLDTPTPLEAWTNWRRTLERIEEDVDVYITNRLLRLAFNGSRKDIRDLLVAGYDGQDALLHLLQRAPNSREGAKGYRDAIQTLLDCGVEVTDRMLNCAREPQTRALLTMEYLRRSAEVSEKVNRFSARV